MTTQPGTQDFDWCAMRERLAAATRGLHASAETDAAKSAALMAERVKKLAQPPAREDADTHHLELVVLLLGKERIGIEAHFVRAVSQFADITAIPRTPGFVMGMRNFRGGIVPVFDIRELFNGASHTHDQTSRIVFLGRDASEFGIVADEVLETVRLGASSLCERPWRSDGADMPASGVTNDALNVLDGAALLADPRFFIGETHATPG
jgi:purine-binding chemotaxis protein CheW